MDEDIAYMKRALALGEQARLLSPPNPWVGCVIVKNNQVIGEGYTQVPGQNHAEIQALKQAKESAVGATVYSTLEPCSHYGKTPPCCRALIEAKVKKVVVAVQDPDPLVAGQGIKALKEAGIEVVLGVCKKEATLSLLPYLHHRQTGKPYCILKTAISLDGRTAAQDGSSKWITCEEARKDAHHLRSLCQGILVGSGTVLKDSPALTIRDALKPQYPLKRIILDRSGRVPASGSLFDTALAPTLVISTKASARSRQNEWLKSGAEVMIVDESASLEDILLNLGKMDILQLLVEGGSELQSSMLRENQAQELVAYVGGVLLGNQGLPAFQGLPIHSIHETIQLSLKNVQRLGNSLRVDYAINQAER